MTKFKVATFIFIFSSPFILSIVSQFNLISPYAVTFDIATMLTPSGILKNYIMEETILTPFYMQSMEQTGRDKTIWIYIVIVLQIWGCFYFLNRLRGNK